MEQPKITIIHPSRQRPLEASKTISHWLENAKDKNQIEYLLSVDETDHVLKRYEELSLYFGVTTHVNDNKSAIEAINASAKIAKGNLLVVVSDDFECPLHWDEKLLTALEGKEDYIVKTQDGIQKTLITLPIMDKKYYNRFGYLYYNGYVHMFSDQEMTTVGHYLGRVIDLPLMFEHKHYSTGKSKKDAVNVKNDATWNQGKLVFNTRKKRNFDIPNPLISYEEIVW